VGGREFVWLTPSVYPFVGCLSTYVENGGWVVAQYVQGRWSVSHGRSLKFARPGGVCCCPVTAYVRISSWTAYVLLVLLAQSQWRTLRSAG